MLYTERVIKDVIERNPGQPEFHQAAKEVLESIAPIVNTNPIYEKHGILERLVEPDRQLLFKVTWVDDNGNVQGKIPLLDASIANMKEKAARKAIAAKTALQSRSGEGYVDTGVKIIIGVVIGGVILAGLYTLFNTTIIPTLTTKIGQMFSYTGA